MQPGNSVQHRLDAVGQLNSMLSTPRRSGFVPEVLLGQKHGLASKNRRCDWKG
jgi:hypothetical protein